MGVLAAAFVVVVGCNSSGTDTGGQGANKSGQDILEQGHLDTRNAGLLSKDSRLKEFTGEQQGIRQDATGQKASALTRGACTPPTSDIVINEIMADPVSPITDADGEWFEVFNPHGHDIDMFNWTIKDDGSDHHQITAHVTVPAGGYAVFCRNGDSNTNGGVHCDYTYTGVTLTNTGDEIVLLDAQGNEVDRVQWTNAVPAGASMELKNPYEDNKTINIPSDPNDSSAWGNSNFGLATKTYGDGTQKGTPGAKNADVYVEQDFAGCDDGNICTWDVCYKDQCDNSQWKQGCCLGDADCNDGDPCTKDTCDTSTNTCTHTAIAGCCHTNDDCQGWDDNPCNYDYCDGSNHCRSSSTTVAGCCWAPADKNPDTGQAWSSPQERQSWADSQCDDKNPCTIQSCDLNTNQCVVKDHVANCCVLAEDCDDGDVCTSESCVNNQCVHTQIDNCCHDDSDCDDHNPCTTNRCVWHECRYFFNPDGVCCRTASDCNQNSNPCIETQCINKRCVDTPKSVCNTQIPYEETFDHPENTSMDRLSFIGYHVTDYPYDPPTDPTKTDTMVPDKEHWVVTDTPNDFDVGPDQFAMFKWNPKIHKVKTVMAGPVLDCTVSNNSWNGSQQTYLEWTQSYSHRDASHSVVLEVVASQDGDFENAPILWQKTVNDDLPFSIEKAPLPDGMKYSSHVQIGFFVKTADTFYMKAWHIDDVILSPGTPNYVWRSSVRECPVGDNLCRNSQPVEEDTNHNEVPDIGMYVNQFYRIWVDVQEPDYSGGTLYYLPVGGFLGAPFDKPSFVYLTKNMDGDQHVGCFRLTAYDHLFRCMFDINPNGVASTAGEYTLGYLVKDDNKGGVFSLHESLSRIHLTVLGLDGYLVWSPDDVDQTEGDNLVAAIKANNRWAQKISNISIVPNFDHIRGIFVNLGVYGQEHILTDAEAQKLADYLDNGGHIYLEGGDFWWTTDKGGRQPRTVLHDYFKTKAVTDGTAKLDSPLTGANFLYGYNYDYSSDYRWNTWLDQIKHKAQKGGREVMRVTGDNPFATVVTWDGGADGYRTIASSVFYSGFKQQNGGKAPTDLMERYIYFLENGYPPCDQDAQCEDFEPCTQDTCQAGVCQNTDIPNCIPCMNDVYKEDGSLSCGTDQACWVAKGYCVDITPNQIKATPAPDQEGLNFGSMQAEVQSKIHVAQPGTLTDMQVKVKITHTYRGDVSLQLKHAGKTVDLLNVNHKDARENIYETYDIGVPISTGDSLDVFNNQTLEGDWYLVAKDNETQGNNGVLDTWSLYASYQPISCTGDSDCDDNNLCTTDSCVNQECQNIEKNCDDGNSSTLDSCDPKTGECIHTPTDHCPNCPCKYHSDCGYDDVCLDNGVVCDPSHPANCKCVPIPGTPFYADTPNGLPQSIPDNDPNGIVLTRTIASGENDTASQVVRRLRVKVVTNHTSISDLKVELCKKESKTCVTLHNYSGGQNLGFYDVYDYDPVDGPGGMNDFKGVPVAGTWELHLIDNVPGHFGTIDHWTLYVVPSECYTDDDCDDGNKCTIDTCKVKDDAGTCSHQAVTCQQPENQCQVNQCDPDTGQCVLSNKPDNAPCEDGLYCTTDDYCKNGQCQSGDRRDCSSNDTQCTVGQCDEATKSCASVNKVNGSPCDDGEACTDGDECEDGVCKSGSTMVCDCMTDADCKDDGLRCNGVIGKCDQTTHKCTYVDGEGPVTCPPSPNECQEYECTEPSGTCVLKDLPDYTSCDDGKYCTVSDHCVSGQCEGGKPRDCSSLDTQCLKGVCSEAQQACVTQNVADGTECEADGDGCTVDECKNGSCVFVKDRDCSSAAYECHYAYCQSVGYGGYTCKTDVMPDGSRCTDDGEPCTDDYCESGTCTHPQSEHCTAKCAGDHPYDAGDDQCGYEDSCAGGINGVDANGNPLGQCTPTCTGTNCLEMDSGLIDLPVSESIGCTHSTLTVNSTKKYVDQAIVKVNLDHQRLSDINMYLKSPDGHEYLLWNNIGGSNADFRNTFDVSFPAPYQYGSNPPQMDSGVPMCRISGDTASGNWTLFVCDSGNQYTGILHRWKLYIKNTDTRPNAGKTCDNPIVIPGTDGSNTYNWNTKCAINNLYGTCGGWNGVERVYKITITDNKHITVTVPQDVLDAAIYVMPESNGTCDTSKSSMCIDSNHTVAQSQKEVWDQVLDAGTWYFVVDTDGQWYDYDPDVTKAITFRVKTPQADGSPCDDNLDCVSKHCANGYCCDHGDCCPGDEWTQNGQDPTPLSNDPNWQSAQNVCPDYYKEAGSCTDTVNCQGHRYDANCVNHMCQKQEVQDDAFCTTSVLSDYCGPYVSAYCTGEHVQSQPQCLTACTSDNDCDQSQDGAGNCKKGCHCDPTEGATLPDAQSSHLVCTDNLPDGSASNEDSDCISDHSANGYCCDHGDCCSGDASVCPDTYSSAPTCTDQSNCRGERTDKTCTNYICGSNTIEDDCACTGKEAGQCGLYIPVYCGCDNTWPPDGSCQYSDAAACESANPNGFTYNGAPACLDNCGTPTDQHDDWCVDIAHCDPDPNNPNIATCQANLPNGSPCNENTDCISKHCQNNYCCNSGDCCSGDPATCPSSYSAPPVCDDPSTCQGHRVDAVCDTTNNKYECGSANVDDDRGCDSSTLEQDCVYYNDIYCNGQEDQTPQSCPSSCSSDRDCAPDSHCDPSECAIDDGACMLDMQSSKLVCKPDLSNDKACNEKSDCTTAYCQTGFCCNPGGCCKGCKVASFMPNLGGGGTDSVTSPGKIRVQSTAGQAGPSGHAEQGGTQNSEVHSTDFGFYPAAAVEKLQ